MGYQDKTVKFSELKGETITEVKGLEEDSERVEFVTANGHSFVMAHQQD